MGLEHSSPQDGAPTGSLISLARFRRGLSDPSLLLVLAVAASAPEVVGLLSTVRLQGGPRGNDQR